MLIDGHPNHCRERGDQGRKGAERSTHRLRDATCRLTGSLRMRFTAMALPREGAKYRWGVDYSADTIPKPRKHLWRQGHPLRRGFDLRVPLPVVQKSVYARRRIPSGNEWELVRRRLLVLDSEPNGPGRDPPRGAIFLSAPHDAGVVRCWQGGFSGTGSNRVRRQLPIGDR
jgi:hypothetical protein